jgi:aryl-alcohol dehydrogenase-like predicted oxidoreductase
MRENVGLLAYSPLAFGVLSGKYLNGIKPEYRMSLFPQFTRYNGENSTKATKLYNDLAEANNLTIAQMALAFVHQQCFVTSTIIGATSMEQLTQNIDAFEVVLSQELLSEINRIQELHPNPAP